MRVTPLPRSVTSAPRRASSRPIVRTSPSAGTLRKVDRPRASNADARIGSAAFLEPETRTSPWRRAPPRMTIFCKSGLTLFQKAAAHARCAREQLGAAGYAGAPPAGAAGAAAAAGAATPACSSQKPALVRGFRQPSLVQIL